MSTATVPVQAPRTIQRLTGMWFQKGKKSNYYTGAIQAPRPQDVMPEHIRQALTVLANQRVMLFEKRPGANGTYGYEFFIDTQPPRPKQANTAEAGNEQIPM